MALVLIPLRSLVQMGGESLPRSNLKLYLRTLGGEVAEIYEVYA